MISRIPALPPGPCSRFWSEHDGTDPALITAHASGRQRSAYQTGASFDCRPAPNLRIVARIFAAAPLSHSSELVVRPVEEHP